MRIAPPAWLAAVATALWLPLAHAAPAASLDPEATLVDELVVTARIAGPAWWRVSNGASTVFILGLPGALPRDFKWDTGMAEHRLKGANELIGPPVVSAGLGDVFALLRARSHFRSDGPMEASLPPDLRERFLKDKASLTKDPKAYSGWTPMVAGLLMIQDFRHKADLNAREPSDTLLRLAARDGVRVVPAAHFHAVPLLRAAQSAPPETGPTCLADALDEIEAGADRVRSAARGWAHGNVGEALSAQRGFEKCLNSLPQGADLAGKAITDTTATIIAALAKPGYSVAAVNLRALLARGGVLQRLQGAGYAVATPDK